MPTRWAICSSCLIGCLPASYVSAPVGSEPVYQPVIVLSDPAPSQCGPIPDCDHDAFGYDDICEMATQMLRELCDQENPTSFSR